MVILILPLGILFFSNYMFANIYMVYYKFHLTNIWNTLESFISCSFWLSGSSINLSFEEFNKFFYFWHFINITQSLKLEFVVFRW